MNGPTVKRKIHFSSGIRGSRRLKKGSQQPQEIPQKIPRMARLMAFAIVFDDMLKNGNVSSYAELSRVTGVNRSRITRIMNLRLLPPEEQEKLLRDI